MSSDPTSGPAAGSGGAPTEEELRAYEAELSRITTSDLMLQAAVSLLNIGGRRLGLAPPPEGRAPSGEEEGRSGRDLEQVRDAIDAVRALLEILGRRMSAELGPLRDALSQLQLAYAREVSAEPAAAPGQAQQTGPPEGEQGAAGGPDAEAGGRRRPGPAEESGRLWVPDR